jgi:hypothetical protein
MATSSIIELAASGRAEDVMRDLRVRCLFSPYFLAKTVLGYTKLVKHLHFHDTELFVSRWGRGQRKQAVEYPRAFFKTTTYTITCSIWKVLPVTEEDHLYALERLGLDEHEWTLRSAIHDQDATQLLAFESAENAEKKVAQIRWHFEENSMFRALFPEIAYTGQEPVWNSKTLIIRRVGARRRDAEGTFEAIGVGGALQSRHYTTVWEDDLVGENARKSEKVMGDTIGWHGRLAGAFENATTGERFLISNRWGYHDLNSYVRTNEPDVVFYTRAAWESDENGDVVAIFPEEYPLERLYQVRDSGSMTRYDFSCQYLNSPTMPGEKEVDLSKTHTYTVAEDGGMYCSCGNIYFPSQMNRYLHFDPYNAKGARSRSCPALVCVGTTSDEHVFVLAAWDNKGSYADVYAKLFELNDRYRPGEFTYEDVGHQNSVEYHWKTIAKTTEYKAAGHRVPPRIVPCGTRGRAMEVRVRSDLFPVIENRKFSTRKTMESLKRQFDTFPNPVFDHDYDLLDALAQGAQVWKFPMNDDTLLSVRSEEEEYKKKLGVPYSYATVD